MEKDSSTATQIHHFGRQRSELLPGRPETSCKPDSSDPWGFITKCHRLLFRFPFTITYRWWWWEIGSLLVSILTMTAVLIILVRVNNTALSSWVFPIRPNSLVSVFMTVSKTALLVPIAECISQAKWVQFSRRSQKLSKLQKYDDASRGPWGAATLLFSRRGDFPGWIASLGALLTIASLALDPFIQQIISYPSRQVALSLGARTAAEISSTQSLHTIDISAMRSAIQTSIYSPKQSPASHFTYKCTTSSCVWNQTINALGVCSICDDITASFTPDCTSTPGPLEPDPTKSDEQKWSFRTTTCTYTIDPLEEITLTVYIRTLTLPAGNGRPAEYASQYTQIKIVSQDSYGGSHVPSRLSLARLLDPAVRWLSTAITYSTFYDKDRPRMPDMTIDELAPALFVCGLYFCARTYNSLAVTNGSLVNYEPSSTVPLGNIPNQLGLASLATIPGNQMAEVLAPRVNSTLINYGNLSSSSSSQAALTTTASEPGPVPTINFTMAQQALFALESHMHHQILNISQSGGNIDFGVQGGTDDLAATSYGLDMEALSASAHIEMNNFFERLARGITGQMWVENGSTSIKGMAMVEETYVKVSWGWVGLPLGVLVLTGLLLGWAVVVTTARWRGHGGEKEARPGDLGTSRRVKMGIWKGSSLALLVCGLYVKRTVVDTSAEDGNGDLPDADRDGNGEGENDGQYEKLWGSFGDLEQLERFADGIKVRLEEVDLEEGRGSSASGNERRRRLIFVVS